MEALAQLAKEVGASAPVSFVTHGRPVRLPDLVEDDLYRIAQEALTNAIRHSSASQITLSLTYFEDEVHLSVVDNGIGFDPGITTAGFGITGMQERAERVGAQLHIYPNEKHGSTVSLELLLQNVRPRDDDDAGDQS